MAVEYSAKIRRLHRAEGLPIKVIARMLGISRNTVRAATNAAMESFFSLLQNNVLHRRRWEHPRGATDRDRHLDRTHPPSTPTPGRARAVDPVEYEAIMTTPVNPGRITETSTILAADPTAGRL